MAAILRTFQKTEEDYRIISYRCISMTDNLLILSIVSEGLLFYANSAIFQLYHDENRLILIALNSTDLFQIQTS
jgi:hypothetical protein